MDQYTDAYSSAAATLNWIYNTESGTSARINLTLDGAWAVTTENEVFPLWCEPSTEDGQTYTISIREGLRWGGVYGEMTAEDWVYMIQNIFQSDWAAYPSQSDWMYTDENGESQPIPVEQTGEREFEVRLQTTDPAWPLRPILWGQYCAPKGLLEQYVQIAEDGNPDEAQTQLEEDEELNNLTYTGNLGAYTQPTWEPEAQFEAHRNGNYYMQSQDDVAAAWQNAPYFETFTQRVIPEESSRLQALRNGEVDTAAVPPNRAQEFIDLDQVDVYVQPQPYVRQVTYNMRANGWLPFRDRRVRQAFMMSVDKQSFSDNVFRGYATPAYTMQPTWSQWYDASQVEEYGSPDNQSLDEARQKIEDALSENDWDYSYDGDTLVDGDGNQAQLSLIAQAGQPTEQTMGEVLKQAFEQLGVAISIETIQGRTFVQNYAYNSVPEDQQGEVPDDWPASPFNAGPRDVATSNEAWDLALIYEFNTYPRTPADSSVFFYERGGINFYGYVPTEGVDIRSIYDEASSTVNEQERQDLFADAFGTIASEQPFGFLVMEDNISGYRTGINGPVEEFGSGWDWQTYFRR